MTYIYIYIYILSSVKFVQLRENKASEYDSDTGQLKFNLIRLPFDIHLKL